MKKLLCLSLLWLVTLTAFATPVTLNSLLTPIGSGDTTTTYTFSGSTPDTVNYLQFCNLGTSNCNGGCLGQYLTINTGTPLSYNVPYHFSTQFFANYLQSYGFTNGAYYIGIYAQSTHWICSSNSKYCSTSSDSIGDPLCVKVTYSGSTVTGLDQQDNQTALLNQSTAQYAYVADATGSIYQCTLATNGTFATCPTPTLPTGVTSWYPAAISFATFNGSQYAYVADGQSQGAVYQCSLDSFGALINCNATPSGTNWSPQFIAFATIDGTQYGYVIDANHDTYACTVTTDGVFNSCTAVLYGVSGVEANALTFTTVVNQGITTQYAYIAALNNGVQQCTLNTSSGSLDYCSATPAIGAPTWNPQAIAIATVGSTQFAYVTSGAELYQCTISNTGALTGCGATPTTAPWSSDTLANVWTATVNGAQYAYIADSTSSTVYSCLIDPTDGTLSSSNCTVTPASSAPNWAPAGITTAYIPGG